MRKDGNMDNVLPELKKGAVLAVVRQNGEMSRLKVRRVDKGREFDEPVYFLTGKYGSKLKNAYTGEDLASQGYKLVGRTIEQGRSVSQGQTEM